MGILRIKALSEPARLSEMSKIREDRRYLEEAA